MTEKRIDIVVTEKGSTNARKRIGAIGDAALGTSKKLSVLEKQLYDVGKANNALSQVNTVLTGKLKAQGIEVNRLRREYTSIAVAQNKAINKQLPRNLASISAAQNKAATGAMRHASAQKQLRSSTKGLNLSLASLAKRVLIFASFTLVARNIIAVADAYTLLQNKLKNVADTQAQVNALTREMFQIANESRAEVGATTQAFQRFDLALKQLGAGQAESIRLTSTVNKILATSGANAGEAGAALLQLSQAFNKGKLDGDEFRSVMELMPPVADAIAKQLGVARGELLLLAPQGKITAEVMRLAFANVADEIDGKFSRLTPTIGQALNVMANQALKFFGEIDKATGVTAAFAVIIIKMAENIDIMAISLGGITIALTAASGGFTFLGAAVVRVSAALYASPFGLIALALTAISVAAYAAAKAFGLFGNESEDSSDQLRKANVELERTQKLTKSFQSNFGVDKALAGQLATLQEIIDTNTAAAKDPFKIIELTENLKSAEKAVADLIKEQRKLKGSTGLELVGKGDRMQALPGLINDESRLIRFFRDELELAEADYKEFLQFTRNNELESPDYKALNDDLLNEQAGLLRATVGKISKNQLLGINQEIDLLGELGIAREIASEKLRLENSIKTSGVQVTEGFRVAIEQEKGALAEAVVERARLAVIQGTLNDLYKASKDDLNDLTLQQEAYIIAAERGIISLERAASGIAGLRVEAAQIRVDTQKLDLGEGIANSMLAGVGKVIDGYTTMFGELSNMYGNFFSTLESGIANAAANAIVYGQDFGEAMKELARTALQQVIKQLIEIAIRTAIVRALGGAIGGAAGGAAGGATTGTVSSTAAGSGIGSAFGQAAPVKLLSSGGYTGNVGRSTPAGIVHGQEYVVNADATANYRPMLEAMNAGKSVGSSVNVQVQNYGSSKIEVQQLGPNDIRIIAREEVSKNAGQVVASEMSQSNSRVSRGITSNFNSRRRR